MSPQPFRRTEWKKIKLDDGAYESTRAYDADGDGRVVGRGQSGRTQ